MNAFKDKYGAESGLLVTCQRCGKQVFRRQIRLDEFEPIPKGWKINRDAYHYYGWWCPDCVKEYIV